MFTLAKLFSISAASWFALPLPVEAKLISPGRLRASAISSRRLFAGSEGCATNTCGSTATSEIGWKSFTGSYGSLLTRLALMACVVAVPSSHV